MPLLLCDESKTNKVTWYVGGSQKKQDVGMSIPILLFVCVRPYLYINWCTSFLFVSTTGIYVFHIPTRLSNDFISLDDDGFIPKNPWDISRQK